MRYYTHHTYHFEAIWFNSYIPNNLLEVIHYFWNNILTTPSCVFKGKWACDISIRAWQEQQLVLCRSNQACIFSRYWKIENRCELMHWLLANHKPLCLFEAFSLVLVLLRCDFDIWVSGPIQFFNDSWRLSRSNPIKERIVWVHRDGVVYRYG